MHAITGDTDSQTSSVCQHCAIGSDNLKEIEFRGSPAITYNKSLVIEYICTLCKTPTKFSDLCIQSPLGASYHFKGPGISSHMWKMILRFHRYLYLSYLTQFGWNIGLCMLEYIWCSCVKLCTVKGLACFPVSIDTLISLFWPNLAEIWACASMT